MKSLLMVLLMMFAAKVAVGQNESLSNLMQCTAIKQDLDRLACFDSLLSTDPALAKGSLLADDSLLTKSSAKPQVETSIRQQGRWEIREKTNPADGVKQISILLDADFGQSSEGENISMVLRCRANLTDMYIIWGDPLSSERVPVVVKLGNANIETELWERSKSLKTSFREKPTHLLRAMMLYEKVVFQVKIDQDPITAVFDISGLSEAIRPIRELCNWTH